jgi:chromosome partitioning protein
VTANLIPGSNVSTEEDFTATTVSLINMKGGVGKTTLTFNLAWYCAWQANMKVLAIDLDPQANLSQYFMGAKRYLSHIQGEEGTIVDVFEQFSAPTRGRASPSLFSPDSIIHELRKWKDGSLLHVVPSRLELAWTLKNPTEKAQLLPQFLAKVSDSYDLIVIDCAPTESILTTAAYMASRYIVVPVKPEFLATIGLPLLARSLEEYRLMHQNQQIEMAGIIFNGGRRLNVPPEQQQSYDDVRRVATTYQWPVFQNEVYHSDSYPVGSRDSTPIIHTRYGRNYVRGEFSMVGDEFLQAVGLP